MDLNTTTNSSVLLVNEHDEVLSTAEKLYVHQLGLLHRAFSVLIFNEKGDYLLQQRAQEKYHSAGLWSNSCCGHPTYATNTETQAQQRLFEEMGFRTTLKPLLTFQYKATLPNGLIEHEIDHVFVGQYQGVIPFNRDEVCAVRWVSPDVLADELSTSPEKFTAWFRLIFTRVQQPVMR